MKGDPMELVAFGTLGFWLAFVIFTILAVAFLEFERNLMAFISIFATLAFFHYAGAWDVVGFAKDHQWVLALYLLGYFAAGAAWSLVKWKLFVNHSIERYRDMRAEFAARLDLSADAEFTLENKMAWKKWIANYHSHNVNLDLAGIINDRNVNPDVAAAAVVDTSKGRILSWIGYWPWSLLWTVIDDPLRKIGRKIYRALKGLYVSIAKTLLEIVRKDLPTALEENAEENKIRADAKKSWEK